MLDPLQNWQLERSSLKSRTFSGFCVRSGKSEFFFLNINNTCRPSVDHQSFVTLFDEFLVSVDDFDENIKCADFMYRMDKNRSVDLFDVIPDLLISSYQGPRFSLAKLKMGVCVSKNPKYQLLNQISELWAKVDTRRCMLQPSKEKTQKWQSRCY